MQYFLIFGLLAFASHNFAHAAKEIKVFTEETSNRWNNKLTAKFGELPILPDGLEKKADVLVESIRDIRVVNSFQDQQSGLFTWAELEVTARVKRPASGELIALIPRKYSRRNALETNLPVRIYLARLAGETPHKVVQETEDVVFRFPIVNGIYKISTQPYSIRLEIALENNSPKASFSQAYNVLIDQITGTFLVGPAFGEMNSLGDPMDQVARLLGVTPDALREKFPLVDNVSLEEAIVRAKDDGMQFKRLLQKIEYMKKELTSDSYPAQKKLVIRNELQSLQKQAINLIGSVFMLGLQTNAKTSKFEFRIVLWGPIGLLAVSKMLYQSNAITPETYTAINTAVPAALITGVSYLSLKWLLAPLLDPFLESNPVVNKFKDEISTQIELSDLRPLRSMCERLLKE